MKRLLLLVAVVIGISGCISLQKDLVNSLRDENAQLYGQVRDAERQNTAFKAQIADRDAQLSSLQGAIDKLNGTVAELQKKLQTREQAQNTLYNEKLSLEQDLRNELSKYQAKLESTERGLVVTFLAEILFDSGKADIKPEAYQGLQKVAEILNTKVKDRKVAVEGHTDNVPITYSDWNSNWELSAARALSVVHYFIAEGHVDPQRLSAAAYGEFNPRQDNTTAEGRRQNRRVEIVILPPLQRQS